jgi:hypothetical protein
MPNPYEYWLHVLSDGTELRFATNPLPILSLRVRVVGREEETYTYNVMLSEGIVSVSPRGRGWALRRRYRDHTSWRRRRVGRRARALERQEG